MVVLEIGDPAPLGLLAFATTTALLMFIDMDWAEANLKEQVWGYATWYGGAAQLIVGILEIIKGNSFGGTAFSTYGAFWLGWAAMWLQYKEGVFHGPDSFKKGEVLWFCTFGAITTGFWIITLRKNLCLVTVFGLLAITFYVLALGVYHEDAKKVAGCFGFATALAAAYTAFAELFSHEFGVHVLPGLQPLHKKKTKVDGAVLEKRITYDKGSNALLMDFRELEVNAFEDIQTINDAVRNKASEAGRKVDAVVNYHNFNIAPHLVEKYRSMIEGLHQDCYASVSRFHAEVFGESPATPSGGFY